MKKILVVMALALGLMLGVGSQQVSAYYLDFNITSAGTTTGQITFDRKALIGTDIEVDFVSLMDNNNFEVAQLVLNHGRLTFNSGYAGSDWNYNGGTITITETFVTGQTMTLMAGNVGSMTVASMGQPMGPYDWGVTFGDFTDRKAPWLFDPQNWEFFGCSIIPEWWGWQPGADGLIGGFQGNLHVGFYGTFAGAEETLKFTSDGIGSGNVNNYIVPIPAAVWLLGSGFFGLVAIRKRRK
jgi:hypothetical protein